MGKWKHGRRVLQKLLEEDKISVNQRDDRDLFKRVRRVCEGLPILKTILEKSLEIGVPRNLNQMKRGGKE